MISLEELRDTATNIVSARFLGPADGSDDVWQTFEYELEVLQIIKGSLRPGRLKVHIGSGHPTLRKGQIAICFLTSDLAFSWCALPKGLQSDPVHDLWQIEGFYDWNAYMVIPSLLSLPMMKAFFLEGRYLDYMIEGPVCFFDPQTPGLRASTFNISLQVTHGKPARYTTNLELNDLGKVEGEEVVGDCWGSAPTMWLGSRLTGRTLRISSTISGIDPATGKQQAQFWMPDPAMYTEEMLRTFLADPTLIAPWFEIAVAAPGGQSWTICLNRPDEDLGDVLQTPFGQFQISEIWDEPLQFITGRAGQDQLGIVTMVNRDDDLGLGRTSTEGAIIQNLMIRAMAAKVYRGSRENPRYLGDATLSLKAVHFSRR